ncbi:MAG: hypothetical protein V4638_10110 [Bacteroidota bacterium]
MLKIFLGTLFLVAVHSCSDFNKNDYLRSLGTLEKTIDSIETVLLENEIDTFPRLLSSSLMLELHLKDEVLSDTLPLEMATQINEFQVALHDLKPLGQFYQSMLQSIPHQRFSVQLLKNEVQNDSGDRHKYAENLAFESKRVKGLNTSLTEFIERKNNAVSAIQRNFSPLTAFYLELRSKKN